MTDQLRIDLDALGRLLPQVRQLAEQVNSGVAEVIPAGGVVNADAQPSLAAAQQMSSSTLSEVRRAVARRFMAIADMIDEGRSQFARADGQLL